jgi:hypothetical protein
MESKIKFKPNLECRLMDQFREVLRYYHYAYSTEQSYSFWILEYMKFYGGKTYPKDMGKNENDINKFIGISSFLHLLDNTCRKVKEKLLFDCISR